jgi:hypothetical protein
MDWLTQAFTEQSIAWLLIFTSVSIGSGFLSSWLTYRFIKRREIIDTQKLEGESQKRERIRQEVIRWANPILASVRDLQSQLRNIIEHHGYLAMGQDYKELVNPNWSISYAYFMDSLPFLFGQYFAWVRMFQEELNFELFQTQDEKDRFFLAIGKVSSALASFPPRYDCEGKDTQVFALQQRAIGDLLIIRDSEHRRCMSYAEFLERMSDQQFRHHFHPLITLLDGIRPEDDCRWKRLQATKEALAEVEELCRDLLEVHPPG